MDEYRDLPNRIARHVKLMVRVRKPNRGPTRYEEGVSGLDIRKGFLLFQLTEPNRKEH